MSAGTFDPAFNPPPASGPASEPAPEPAPATEPSTAGLAPAPTSAVPPLTRAFRALGWLATEGASLGFAGWCLRARDHLLNYVANNSMPPAARKYVFGNMLAGAALAGLTGLVSILWRRRGGLARVEGVARRLAPLCLAGLLPIFFQWQLWYGGRELTFIVMVSAFVLGLQALTRVSLETAPILPASLRARLGARLGPLLARVRDTRWLPSAIVFTAFLGYTVYFSIITIQNHFRLQTMGWDLGIENSLVWNAAHFNRPMFKTSVLGNQTTTHIGFHETYISYLIGIFYRLAPRPETLLALQAALIGGAVLPFFAFARRHVGAWTACLLAVLINLYAPLHGSNLYDFHYLPFAPIFLWWSLWALESRRNGMAVVAVILTLANREDMSALLMFIGLYLILTGERPKAGLVVTIVSAAYFVGIKLILMPHFLNGYPAYINQYEGLLPEGDNGFGGILKTVFGNPAFTVTSLLEHDKVLYLLEIVAPLAFFPWRRPVGLLLSVPGFLFTMLATHYPPLLSISFQYTAYWTAFYFIAVVANLAWLRRLEQAGVDWARRSRRAWLVAITAGTIITSYQLGIVLQRNTAWGGFSPFHVGVTDADRARHADLYSLIQLIPQEATVAASETIVAHISSRKNAYSLRIGFNDADYLLVRLPSGGEDRGHVIDALKSGLYGMQAQKGEFVLFRRGLKEDTAAPFLRQLGA